MANELSREQSFTAMVMLVAVNLLPIWQVWAGEWTVVQLVLLFWLETLLLVLLDAAVLKWPPFNSSNEQQSRFFNTASGFFVLPFLLLQAIPLCAAYFLIDIDGVALRDGHTLDSTIANPSIWWVLAMVLVVNLLNIRRDLQLSNGRRHPVHEALVRQAIGRLFCCQVVIILGAMIAIWLREPLWLLLVLVFAKTGFDLLVYWFANHDHTTAV
ncbi:MAG: DUF6498-containing protein [Pseudomonadota bacterium]